MNKNIICVFCGDPCNPAPTKRGWVTAGLSSGLHFDCAEKVASIGRNISNLESPSTPLSVEEAAKAYADAKADSKWNKAAELERAFIAGAAYDNRFSELSHCVENLLRCIPIGEPHNNIFLPGFTEYLDLTKHCLSRKTQPTPIPSDIVQALTDANPYQTGDNTEGAYYAGWENCASELRRILSSQPSQGSVQGLIDALTEITQQPGEWNECKQVARKALADYKYPGMTNLIKAQSGNHE